MDVRLLAATVAVGLVLLLPASGVAQQNTISPISYDYLETPLSEVIRDLESRYSLTFSYVNKTIDGVRITATVTNQPMTAALQTLFKSVPVSFVFVGSSRVVLYVREIALVFGAVKGIVVDAKSREPLPYVNILLNETGLGTYSDLSGRFAIKRVPIGEYDLRVTDVSHEYSLIPITVVPGETSLDTIFLEPRVYEGQDIVITATKNPLQITDERLRIQPGVRVLKREHIVKTPSILEPDLFRALQTLPGVATTNDLSNEIYVRGGTPDQNLILLDRAVVYQPYHLFGISGIFNTDFIDEVYFSPGGFGAQYGDRLSSVIDVRSKSSPDDSVSTKGTISLLSSKITTERQINPQWYCLASLRRTYVDYASSLVKVTDLTSESIPYHFYDGYGKIIYTPNRMHKAGVSVFLSRDDFQKNDRSGEYYYNPITGVETRSPYFSNDNNQFIWGNLNLTLFWEATLGDEVKSRLTIYRAGLFNDLSQNFDYVSRKQSPDSIRYFVDSLNRLSDETPLAVENYLTDRTIAVDIEVGRDGPHKILIGGYFSDFDLQYQWKNLRNTQPDLFQVFFDHAPDSFRYKAPFENCGVYIEDLWMLGKWTVRPGLRIDKYGTQRDILLSPRLAIRYDWDSRLAIKASGGLYHQSMFTSRERGYVGFLEIPFATESLAPERAWQATGGVEWFHDYNRRLSVDAYFKNFMRLYRNRRSTSTSPVFDKGEGRAYGAEVNFRQLGRKFSYEISYSLAWVDRLFYGQRYYTNYDQRHSLSILGSYQLPAQWSFDFRWAFSSGRAYRPYSFTSAVYYYESDAERLFGGFARYRPRSSYFEHLSVYNRFPVYHRLDVSLIKTIRYEKWTFKPFVNIVNAYYQTNPLYYDKSESNVEYLTNEPEPRRFYVSKRKPYGIPILPSIGAHFEF